MNRRDEKRFRRRWVAGLFARAAVICVFATTAIDASGETETYAPYSARVIYELLRASMHGDSVELRRLLESADPTLVNWRFPSTGETPVFLASVSGHADAVIYLLSKGASPNAYTPAGDGPLLLSSDLGHLHIVRALLANGANPNGGPHKNGWTPLIMAAMRGHLEIVQALLAAGAEVNAQVDDGNSATSWARKEGHEEIVSLLKAKGGREFPITPIQNGGRSEKRD